MIGEWIPGIERISTATFGDLRNFHAENEKIFGGFEDVGWTRDIETNETIIDGGEKNRAVIAINAF